MNAHLFGKYTSKVLLQACMNAWQEVKTLITSYQQIGVPKFSRDYGHDLHEACDVNYIMHIPARHDQPKVKILP